MLAALIRGASSPWVGGPITVIASYVVLPLMQDLLRASAGLGLPDETKRFAVHIGTGFLWSLAFGFVFGVPLGFFVAGASGFIGPCSLAGQLWQICCGP